ncbi:MAG: hypothetical protein LC649_03775 [Bacteroidales bacterium]|nr:hypothetical protein [Bacteroidales bacterium]
MPQEPVGDTAFYRKDISRLFLAAAYETDDNRRRQISDSLIAVTGEYLSSDIPFEHIYSDIRYMGYYMASDSLVKIVSWNIPLNDGSNSYICFVVRRTGEEKHIYLLRGERGTLTIDQHQQFALEEWYGALYYDIIPFKSDNSVLYLLPGLDMNDLYTNGKVIEIMGFGSDGIPYFGDKVIRSGDSIISRMLFRYSSNSSMMLRYESEREWMVFDHLSPAEPAFSGVYSYYGPDSSYDALELRGGEWVHIRDVDLRNRQ